MDLKTPLTPLASTEKKTLSGFDIRLASLKGPARLKASRRRGPFLYSEVYSNKASVLENLSPLAPFISQGRGWGVRSSRANSYLRSNPFSGFNKPSPLGFFGIGFLPNTILMQHRQAILSGEGAKTSSLLADGAFLISSDINQGCSLLVRKTFFEGKSENPNTQSQRQSSQLDYAVFNREWAEYLSWATGVGADFGFYLSTGFLVFSKTQVARK